jgi:type II secretory pathway pseudopilin PulG
MKHLRLRAVAAAAILALVAAAAAQAAPRFSAHGESPAVQRQLRAVKAALDKYQDVAVAKADGYAVASPCLMVPTSKGASWWGGAMGVHFVNQALLTKPLNPLKPAVLTYLPTANGGFRLLAAEYFKADADQKLSTDSDRPSLFGRSFDGPMLGHSPGMPIHYDLHVWLWKPNPVGLFSPWNPTVHC